jgi:hypothetical protein
MSVEYPPTLISLPYTTALKEFDREVILCKNDQSTDMEIND